MLNAVGSSDWSAGNERHKRCILVGGNNTSSGNKLIRKEEKAIRGSASGIQAYEAKCSANSLTLGNFALVNTASATDVEGDGAAEDLKDDRTGVQSRC